MPRPEIEKTYPEYALAYLRYLAGERDTVPTANRDASGAVQYRGISRSEIALAQARIRELVRQAAAHPDLG